MLRNCLLTMHRKHAIMDPVKRPVSQDKDHNQAGFCFAQSNTILWTKVRDGVWSIARLASYKRLASPSRAFVFNAPTEALQNRTPHRWNGETPLADTGECPMSTKRNISTTSHEPQDHPANTCSEAPSHDDLAAPWPYLSPRDHRCLYALCIGFLMLSGREVVS